MEDVRHTKGLLACEQAITEASARCSLCFLHSQFATIKNQEPVGVNDPWIPCRKPAQGNTEHQEASGDFLPQIKIRGCVSTAFIPILNSECLYSSQANGYIYVVFQRRLLLDWITDLQFCWEEVVLTFPKSFSAKQRMMGGATLLFWYLCTEVHMLYIVVKNSFRLFF